MNPDRWQRVQEVLLAATEREPGSPRAEFLEEVCRGDPELKKEVESLLATFAAAPSSFLESPAIDGVPALSSTGPAGSRVVGKGTRLGPYEILSSIGAGGMGEVYRARDERLGRDVAIKVLSGDVAADSVRLKRFEKEARSASALNHPNIVTIHDTGFSEGVAWIAMERVDGETLRKLWSGGPVPIKKVLSIAPQVAEGLAKAHEAGIVHRDLKPENVMVTKDGLVKILDFGLAKLTSTGSGGDEGSKLPTMSGTTPGAILGTVGYMSPEQAGGATVDFRSDQFSFGSILYELVTGKRAFAGKTPIDVLGAILNDEPPPIGPIAPQAPTQLRWIIERCLAKEPRQRYSSTDDLARDLATLRDHLSEATSGTAVGPRARRRRRPAVLGVLALVLAAGAIFQLTKRPAPPRGEPKLRQLTSRSPEKPIGGGAISPDGKYLAYADAKGMSVQLIETGETRSVPEPEALRGLEVNWDVPCWFSDSTRFVANAHPMGRGNDEGDWGSQGTSIWTALVLGGAPRKLRDDAIAYATALDGSLIAFGANKGKVGDREIWLMDGSGERARKLFETDANNTMLSFAWIPGGPRVSYLVGNPEAGGSIVSRDLKGGPPVTIIPPAEFVDISQFLWCPEGRLIFAKGETPQTGLAGIDDSFNFWELKVDPRTGETDHKPRRLTNWTGVGIGSSTASADGKRLAFSRWKSNLTVYVADLEAGGTRIANTRHFTLTESKDQVADWTTDGKTLILMSNRTGTDGVYKQALDEDAPTLLVPGDPGLSNARLSGDGDWVLYQRDTDAKDPVSPREVLRVPLSGGSSQVITTTRSGSVLLRARPPSNLSAIAEPTEDKKRVVVTALDPVKGRGAELASWDLRGDGRWDMNLSPDGTRLAAVRSSEGPISILSLRGDPPLEVRPKGARGLGSLFWAADGKGLFVSSVVAGGAVLLHVDLDGNVQILRHSPGTSWAPGIPSPDGRQIAMIETAGEGNFWLMENF